jgi:hypothetical protein
MPVTVPPFLFGAPGTHTAPFTYTVPGSGEVAPYTATATFDGTGSSGVFVPCLSMYSQDGVLLARLPLTVSTIAQGGSAEVTWAPFLGTGTGAKPSAAGLGFQKGGVLVGTEPIVDFIDSTSSTFALVDDTVNTRVTVTATATGSVAFTFGDGSDGALHYDGTTTILGMAPVGGVYTLTRDINATSIIVDAAATIKPSGWRIFATGTLSNAGSINANGNAPNLNNGGVAQVNTGYYTFRGYGGGAGAGGVPGAPGADTPTGFVIGGSGGHGGTTATAAGGLGGVASPNAQVPSQKKVYAFWLFGAGISSNAATPTLSGMQGGAGGGAGGPGPGPTNHAGQGGGGGGGVLFIAAHLIANTGTISANGGNCGAVTFSDQGIGGGGGAGGVGVFSNGFTGNTPTVAGGTKGTGGVTTAATDGAVGTLTQIVF